MRGSVMYFSVKSCLHMVMTTTSKKVYGRRGQKSPCIWGEAGSSISNSGKMPTEAYQIENNENGVVVRTTSFKTERRSVLHSGIFNRELASSLAAGAVMVIMGFFFAFYFRITVVHFIAAV